MTGAGAAEQAPGWAQASAVSPRGPGRFALEVDPSWLQGRGAYGGIVAAWLLRAMQAELGSPGRTPRALSCQFCAPARPGPAELRVRRLRETTTVSFLAAELVRDERVIAHGTAVLGAPRTTKGDERRAVAPAVPPAAQVPPWRSADLPVYTQHVELRPCLGDGLLGGGTRSLLGGWTRLVQPAPLDAALAAALLDSWPPACFARLERPLPAGTVDIAYRFYAPLPDPALDPEAPVLVQASSRVTADGYSEEEDTLWAPDGRLLASAHQLVALSE